MKLAVYVLSTAYLWYHVNGLYAFVADRLSKDDAEAYCAATYTLGKLATIDNDAQQAHVAALCAPDAPDRAADPGCWIGYTLTSGAWDDASSVYFTNFGELSRDAVVISSTTGEWRDVDSDQERPFICEYSGSTLYPDESLYVGQQLVSDDGVYYAILQEDGNFVEYSPTTAIWYTGTLGNYNRQFIYQSDGNIVLYDIGGGAVWNSGTIRCPGYLIMQSDGNLVAYDCNNAAYWDSLGHTSENVLMRALNNWTRGDHHLRYQVQMVAAVAMVLLVAGVVFACLFKKGEKYTQI